MVMMMMIKVQRDRGLHSFLPLSSCVALRKLLHLSGPHCNRKVGIINPLHKVAWGSICLCTGRPHSTVPGLQ